jgi:hypothetical protein
MPRPRRPSLIKISGPRPRRNSISLRPAWLIASALCLSGNLASAAYGASSCRTSPNLVGACFAVHGRIFVSNITRAVHLALADNGRVLDVLGREAWTRDKGVLPTEMEALLASSGSGAEVEGDYVVCPFDRTYFAQRQAVCIQDASHLIARHR